MRGMAFLMLGCCRNCCAEAKGPEPPPLKPEFELMSMPGVKVAKAPPEAVLPPPVVASAVLPVPAEASPGWKGANVVAMFEISQSYLLN